MTIKKNDLKIPFPFLVNHRQENKNIHTIYNERAYQIVLKEEKTFTMTSSIDNI